MTQGVISVELSSSTGGQAIMPLVAAHIVDLMTPESYGLGDSLVWIGPRIHTITLTEESQILNPLSPSLTIRGKVAKIRHETDTISYWVDGPGTFTYDKGWKDYGSI